MAAAETVVSEGGAAALSFANVAAAAGVSKGAVQGQFRSRERLVEAMLQRWLSRETERFETIVGSSPDRRDRVLAHVATMSQESGLAHQRVATLLASFVAEDRSLKAADQWYASRIETLEAQTEEERWLRLSFLAAEGLFFVRYVVGYSMDETTFQEIFRDIGAMADLDRKGP